MMMVNEPELLPAAIPMIPISPADRTLADALSELDRSRSQISRPRLPTGSFPKSSSRAAPKATEFCSLTAWARQNGQLLLACEAGRHLVARFSVSPAQTAAGSPGRGRPSGPADLWRCGPETKAPADGFRAGDAGSERRKLVLLWLPFPSWLCRSQTKETGVFVLFDLKYTSQTRLRLKNSCNNTTL